MIQLDHLFENTPGILLSVKEDGHPIQHYVSGIADVQTNLPMTSDRLFRSGLITRTFTAAILLRLADQQTFDLDAPLEILAREHQNDRGLLSILVTQYPFLKPVSVRELLNNTSGLPAFDRTIAYNEIFIAKPRKVWVIENYLDVISGVSVRYQHGYETSTRGHFSDSGTNFLLAGLVIEAVSGMKTSEMMRNLFREFSLNNTQYLSYGVMEKNLLPRMIHGYLPTSHPYAAAFEDMPYLTYNANKELRAYDVTMAYTINGMGNAASVSTASDLIHWLEALLTRKVVVGHYKQLLSGVPARRFTSDQKDYYCLGFYKTISKKYGEVIWSAGNSLGYSTLLAHSIDKKITFVLMVNVSRLHFSLHSEGLIASVLNNLFITNF